MVKCAINVVDGESGNSARVRTGRLDFKLTFVGCNVECYKFQVYISSSKPLKTFIRDSLPETLKSIYHLITYHRHFFASNMPILILHFARKGLRR